MNRGELQTLAEARLSDAEVLLREGRWGAAYYLLGYAIECALKACAARQFREHEVPEKSVINDFYTHRFDRLLTVSGAGTALEQRVGADPLFRANWNTVLKWSEDSRYDHSVIEEQARGMFVAVADPSSGVLPWLKTWW